MKLIYSTLITLIVITISITIIIIISIITSIIIIIINSTKNDVWDMEELFHKLETKFDALLAQNKKVLSLLTFSCIYPIDRLDWALFSVVLLFHHLFPLLEKVEIRAFILPRNFPAVLIIFTGRGREPPPPHSAGRGGEPPLPRGEGSSRGGASIPGGNVLSLWNLTLAP